jgi:hypothetical protein
MPPGSVKVILAGDYTGPGSGLGSETAGSTSDTVNPAAVVSTDDVPAPPPIITAGSSGPECVN